MHSKRSGKFMLVFYETTTACELNCIHCRANASLDKDENELTTQEAKNLILEISNIEGVTPLLVFTGGNPMLRQDLFELMEYSKHNHTNFSLSPAVTDLLTKDALFKIKEAGTSSISVSLDGSTPNLHNGIRRYDSFARTIEVIREAISMGLRIQVNTTVMQQNVRDLPNILSLLVDLKVPVWEVFFLIRTGRGTSAEEISAVEAEDVNVWLSGISPEIITVRTVESPMINRTRIQRLGAVKRPNSNLSTFLEEMTDKTFASSGFDVQTPTPRIETLFISSAGNVFPSGFLPLTLGNIRDKSLYRIYGESPVLEKIRKTKDNLRGKCSYCDFRYICGGSRARAFANLGDYLAPDPMCTYNPAPLNQ